MMYKIQQKTIITRERLPLIIIMVVAIIFSCYCCLNIPDSEPIFDKSGATVRILLKKSAPGETIRFSINGPYKIFRGEGPKTYSDENPIIYGQQLKNAKASFNSKDGIKINKNATNLQCIEITVKNYGDLKFGKTKYRGVFQLKYDKEGRFCLFNMIGVEHYLAGVLLKEMPSSFHDDALKAQAVAARSYVLYRQKLGAKYITDDEFSQVYGGMSAETDRSRAIVKSTLGQVLTYTVKNKNDQIETKILPAFYSSTCGGITARASDAFSGFAPDPVNHTSPCEYCVSSPTYNWSASFTKEQIKKLLELPQDLSDFDMIITKFCSLRRALEISIRSSGAIIKKIKAGHARVKLNEGRALKDKVLSTLIQNITKDKDSFTIEGRGWGHGVGLCQYGAQGLATNKRVSYDKILDIYFPNAKLSSEYGNK